MAAPCAATAKKGMRQLVLAGMGLVHAVFVEPGLQVPARVRVMLDYLLEKVRLGQP